MKRFHKGAAGTTAIIALAAVIGIGVIWYFVSDVFHTKVDAAADQYTHWTPENIAKDPVNYLNFCETETKKAIEGLKADQIAVAENSGRLKDMKEECEKKVAVGETSMTDLKKLYEANDSASGTWPVSWKGQNLDRNALKLQMVTLYHETETQKNLLSKLDGGLAKLATQDQKIADARGKANDQLTEIATNKQLLSVQKITDDLTNRLVAMKGALRATVDTASESKGTVSLDALAADAAAAPPSNAEFDKIVSKVK